MTVLKRVISIIDREIASVNKEIQNVDEVVGNDIDELLIFSCEYQDKEKTAIFIDRHFGLLRRKRIQSLEKALERLKCLRNETSIISGD